MQGPHLLEIFLFILRVEDPGEDVRRRFIGQEIVFIELLPYIIKSNGEEGISRSRDSRNGGDTPGRLTRSPPTGRDGR